MPPRKRLRQTKVEPVGSPNNAINWRRWCRLCAKCDYGSNVDIFSKDKNNVVDGSLATAIGKYFWVNIKMGDDNSQFLCVECHTLITSLVSFTERVNKAQAMFCLLQSAPSSSIFEPNEVRMQYGLLEDEFKHIIQLPTSEKKKPPNQDVEIRNRKLYKLQSSESEVLGEELNNSSCDESEVKTEQKNAEYDGDEEEAAADDNVATEETVGGNEEEEYCADDHLEFLLEADSMDAAESEEITFEIDNDRATKGGVGENDHMAHLNNTESDDSNEEHDNDDDYEDTESDEVDNDMNDAGTVNDADLLKESKYSESLEMGDKLPDAGIKVEKLTPTDESKLHLIGLLKRKRGRPSKSTELTRLSIVKHDNFFKKDADSDPDRDYVNERRYECKICPRKYKNPTSYRKHMVDMHQMAPDIPDFTCEKCPDKVFPTEKQLAMHLRTHLPLEQKLDIPCPYCDRKFTKISVMRQHVNGVHRNQKPFVCDQCGRALKTLAALNEHKLVHTNDCPYECEVCHKRFKNKARLKIHSDIHNETSYVCPKCGLQLNTRRTLKMHMLVHSDEKQFPCNFCGSAFKRGKALKNHLILHSGMRPYKCSFCERSFSNGSNCRSHKKKVHPKELAEQEAQGKKATPTAVPKIDELRLSSNVVKCPREVTCAKGGLPRHLRELLINAEQRAKLKEAKVELHDDSVNDDATILELQQYDTLGSEDEFITEIEPNTIVEEVAGDDVGGEPCGEEDGETVIYEIIDEI